ncbi:ATP-binding protein [Peribacillus sp. NPDC096448]|uniref:HD domain-containing protein n=1 Tax=Peribacillus sp. NPDC096448 TaxID=3364395 RepID=UPI0037FD0736
MNGPINDLEETRLYQLLVDREDREEKLSEKVKLIVRHIAPLLARIPEKMPEYTLHDATHSIKVIRIMGKIIPEETLEKLNSIELTLLIISGYLHDIGMTCSTEEREMIIESKEFEQIVKLDSRYEEYLNYKKTDHREATFIEDSIFTEYLRKNHVKRSAEFIERLLIDGKFELSIDDIPLYKYVVAICNGHGEPVKSLYNTKIWPRDKLIKGEYVNIQYLTIILRLADILDLDPERTPKVIFEFVNPKNTVSIQEWQKHRSFIGWDIKPNNVVVEAECNFPEVERTLRLFLQWIELERRESIELLRGYTDSISQKYTLLLTEPITADRVTSDGSYIYSEVKFELDYKKVINLLMGERLYRNPITALRELLQNAIDAIKARQYLYLNRFENFIPTVSIKYSGNKLIIEDNGIGMSDNIFADYFLQVGKSYYSTARFRETDLGITSEFGIGILSAFMIADSMVIESLNEPEDRFSPPLPIYYKIPTAHGYCVKKPSNRETVGTRIELILKENHPFTNQSIIEVVEKIIPHPPFPIEITTDDGSVTYNQDPKEDKLVRFEDHVDTGFFHEKKFRRNNNFSHYVFEIDSNELLKLGIEGQLYIVNGSEYLNFEGRLFGSVSQRNFQIGSPNHSKESFEILPTKNIQDLFPKWTNVYSNINLIEQGCLTITPDRTEVLLDDKYQQLKKKIERLIISEFRKHLNSYMDSHSFDEYCGYVDSLIDIGFIGAPTKTRTISEEAKEFFFDIIYFPTIDFNGGILRKQGKDLNEYRYLGVIDRNWSKDYLPKLADYAFKENLHIIVLSEFSKKINSDIANLISQLYGTSERFLLTDITLVSPVSGIHIKVYDKERIHKIIDDYDIASRITSSLNNGEKEILCVPSDRGRFYHRFNKSHPLIRPLFNNDEYKNEEADDLLQELCDEFDSIMSNSVDKMDNFDLEWLKILKRGNHVEIAKGVFIRIPEVFKEFNRELVSFWGKLVNMDLVDESVQMPQIDVWDFPWYFNSQLNYLDN